jgi:intracellular sulfur oxidation DsrE/DsrF family protein
MHHYAQLGIDMVVCGISTTEKKINKTKIRILKTI